MRDGTIHVIAQSHEQYKKWLKESARAPKERFVYLSPGANLYGHGIDHLIMLRGWGQGWSYDQFVEGVQRRLKPEAITQELE